MAHPPQPAGGFSVLESSTIVGGQPAIRLCRTPGPETAITEVQVLPGVGCNVWQIRATGAGRDAVDLIAAPPLASAPAALAVHGNAAFQQGSALLIPFANRLRGRFDPSSGSIATPIGGFSATLAANGRGRLPGAEPHALHGLFFSQLFRVARREADARAAIVEMECTRAFPGAWPGRFLVRCRAELNAREFAFAITVRNSGDEPLPAAIGWHPHFQIPSGDRSQARLRIPGRGRVVVDNYDNLFPTGEIVPVAHTSFDFRAGRTLADQPLDGCFCDLDRDGDGAVTAELQDPASGLALQLSTRSAPVLAVHCYAPRDRAFVAIEPQYNLADPFAGRVWRDRDTGMVWLAPGDETELAVSLRLVPL